MQIRFTPHKLRASKAYISNLMADNNIVVKDVVDRENYVEEDKKRNISLFKKFIRLFR